MIRSTRFGRDREVFTVCIVLATESICSACGTPAPPPFDCSPPVDATTAAELTLRSPTADRAFRELGEGGEVLLTAGHQGGVHVSFELEGSLACPNSPWVEIVLRNAGVVVGRTESRWRWTSVDGRVGSFRSIPLAVVIAEDRYCPVLAGAPLEVDATVNDEHGVTAHRVLTVRLVGWAQDSSQVLRESHEACCADPGNRICWPDGVADAGTSGP